MPIEIWTTHSLEKIFVESRKPISASETIRLKAGRNETEDAQIAVHVPGGPEIAKASFQLPDLVGPRGARIPKRHLSAHWLWYLYVLRNPHLNVDPTSYLRQAPAFFPDAFLEEKTIRILDNRTQPLWVSVHVPKGTPAGDYTGTIALRLEDTKGATHRSEVPISVTVWPFTLPDRFHLRHTEWFAAEVLADYYRIEPWSDAHWDWIKKAATDMARHHQDMILTPFFSLVKVARAASGRFRYDFRDLDRWVRIFKKAGVDWIEGAHVAGRVAGWESQIGWQRFRVQGPDGKPIDTSRKTMSDEEFESWMRSFLQAVHAHLERRGWHKRYVQHVADEPVPDNEASWSHCARRTRQWLPGVQTIDAVMSGGLEGLIDIRVPQIQEITPDTPRNPKEDLWSYVCLAPQGQYPNRFLDYPSIRNRIIFWLSWSLDLKGFLHWGYSHWAPWGGVPARIDVSPWLDASGASIYCQDDNPLPSGDTHIVYPGGHTICSSLRWEVIRKGMEDFELLRMLERAVERDKGKRSRAVTAARRLLKRIREDLALSPGQHTRCDAALLAAREEAGELLARLVPDRR